MTAVVIDSRDVRCDCRRLLSHAATAADFSSEHTARRTRLTVHGDKLLECRLSATNTRIGGGGGDDGTSRTPRARPDGRTCVSSTHPILSRGPPNTHIVYNIIHPHAATVPPPDHYAAPLTDFGHT